MESSDWICINFTRTLSGQGETLADFGALVDWAERSDVVPADAVHALRERAQADPVGAARDLAVAIELRESIYRVLEAVVDGKPAEPEHVERLNQVVRRAGAHRGIADGPGRYEWTWQEEESDPFEQILWRVAQSAAELLTSEWVGRLGVCRGDRCLWLFVDRSRNRSRRWCDMGDCGNLAKVRAFRERARAGQA
jgi:predicted RNA-binding Zn ribbon-like protein